MEHSDSFYDILLEENIFPDGGKKQKNKNGPGLLLKILAVCLCSVLLLITLNYIYEQDMANYDYEAEKLEDIGNPVLVNVGSSHGEYAFYYGELWQQGVPCANLALSSQMFDYDMALLRQFREDIPAGATVLIPVSYFSFNDETTSEADIEARSIRYYKYVDPQYIPDYDWFIDLTTHHLPILSAGSKILKLPYDFLFWGKDYVEGAAGFKLIVHAAETDEAASAAETKAEETGAGTAETDACEVPEELRLTQEERTAKYESFEETTTSRIERHFGDRSEFFRTDRVRQLEEIIDFCRENDWTPVLITTPFFETYTDAVDEDFRIHFEAVVRNIADGKGVPYYDYSMDERFRSTIEYFGDPDHLNNDGGKLFIRILYREVPEVREVLEPYGLQGFDE